MEKIFNFNSTTFPIRSGIATMMINQIFMMVATTPYFHTVGL
ncbi:uncharacterized protein METZ01_LOCUS311610 [marine metagenome]|uniref:Uncharacterized protein n=1 Tax=marine metagenome TaxID=408172 RepID=A0A382NCI0_9ZZZZ